MTLNFNNVYLNETATITGPYEENGPLGKYFDYSYKDLYFGAPSWEQAESKLINETIDLVLGKAGISKNNIDALISGDLLNQTTSTSYAAKNTPYSLIGVYAACATSTLTLALASLLAETGKTILCTTSSHNNAAEKQFRYPVEYGGPKPKTTTFTSTGGVAAIISNKKSKIKIESATIGTVIDSKINDVFNMGAVMAPAAADTIYKHLKNTNRKIDYYDLILTGDLGLYGKKILKEYMQEEYNITLNNHEDSGPMLYDIEKQPVYAGASGPACLPLVTYSHILKQMKDKKLKKVLLVATGALHSQSTASQKLTIPAVAHAVSLEVVR
ncbi:MAG: stage V sporulation protein AD [Bacilli bacterium]|nr:stage V sporulation protein AD [Bacilli bacterium]